MEDIIELKPYADYDEALGKGFINPERFLRIVYGGLKGE